MRQCFKNTRKRIWYVLSMWNECFVASEEVGEFSKRPTDACADKSVPVPLEIVKVFLFV